MPCVLVQQTSAICCRRLHFIFTLLYVRMFFGAYVHLEMFKFFHIDDSRANRFCYLLLSSGLVGIDEVNIHMSVWVTFSLVLACSSECIVPPKHNHP